jgi:hypothetical protein
MEVMANWLKPFSAPPLRKAASLPAKPDFDAKLRAFKNEHGFRERYTMLCYCTRHGRPFETVFERASASERFTVSAMNMLGEQAGGSGSAAATPSAKRFNIAEFDTSAWHCPYCRSDGWVHCHCGTNTCSHQLKLSGGSLHRCEPGCGAASQVVPLLELEASSASGKPKAAAKPASKAALPCASRQSLPSPNQPRLPGIR